MGVTLQAKPKAKIKLEKFGGLDFSTDATLVSINRSPDCMNMIADNTFYPKKRFGWKYVYRNAERVLDNPVHNFYDYMDNDGNEYMVVHIKDKLYKFVDGETPILTEIKKQDGTSVTFNNGFISTFRMAVDNVPYLFILGGTGYYAYNGSYLQLAKDLSSVYIPTTSVGRLPSGGGSSFDAVNMLTNRRINTFTADGTSTVYQLDSTNCGDYIKVTISNVVTTAYTFNKANGTVTFTSAPASDGGIDSVAIEFETGLNQAEKLGKCTLCNIYSKQNSNIIFVSGNPDYKNWEWYSEANEPLYFPDNNYNRVGYEDSSIIGYSQFNTMQIIFKDGVDGDSTQYIKTMELDDNGIDYYPIYPSSTNVKLSSINSIITYDNVPMFMSDKGYVCIDSTNLANQIVFKNKSRLINKRLLDYRNELSKVSAQLVDDKIYLCVNNVGEGTYIYVADTKQKYIDKEEDTVSYEWYLWNEVPATTFHSFNNEFYFGTKKGDICKFKKETSIYAYHDGDGCGQDGQLITAYWKTPLLNLGVWGEYKDITNVFVTPTPYSRSTIDVYYITDKYYPKLVKKGYSDIFSFEDVDFARFTFNTMGHPQTFATKRKARKVKLFQIMVSSQADYEPVGFISFEIEYRKRGNIR